MKKFYGIFCGIFGHRWVDDGIEADGPTYDMLLLKCRQCGALAHDYVLSKYRKYDFYQAMRQLRAEIRLEHQAVAQRYYIHQRDLLGRPLDKTFTMYPEFYKYFRSARYRISKLSWPHWIIKLYAMFVRAYRHAVEMAHRSGAVALLAVVITMISVTAASAQDRMYDIHDSAYVAQYVARDMKIHLCLVDPSEHRYDMGVWVPDRVARAKYDALQRKYDDLAKLYSASIVAGLKLLDPEALAMLGALSDTAHYRLVPVQPIKSKGRK